MRIAVTADPGPAVGEAAVEGPENAPAEGSRLSRPWRTSLRDRTDELVPTESELRRAKRIGDARVAGAGTFLARHRRTPGRVVQDGAA